MPIGSTTVATLKTTFATRIIAITPDYVPETSKWRRRMSIKDVPSVGRNFYISIDGQRLSENGVHTSNVATYDADLKIWTSYIGMRDDDYENAKSEDAAQIWTALSAAGGAITGLFNIIHESPMWEDAPESEEGARWGAHVFTIKYLLEQP